MDTQSHKPTVLVVEDESIVRLCTVGMLEDAQFEVLGASNAEQALEILETHSDINVVFTDVNMPGKMDGFGLALEVEARWPAIHLVLTSGKVGFGRGSIPGHGRFVPKPYSPETIARVVTEVMAAA
jgi:CheY-like chemotaxis protein